MGTRTKFQLLFISVFIMTPFMSHSADIYSSPITAIYHECSIINLSGQKIPESGSLLRLTDKSGKVTFAKKKFNDSLPDGETVMQFYSDPNEIAIPVRCEVTYNGSPIDTLASHCGFDNMEGKSDEKHKSICSTLW